MPTVNNKLGQGAFQFFKAGFIRCANFIVKANIEGNISISEITRGLRHIQSQHPNLQIFLKENLRGVFLEPADSQHMEIPLSVHPIEKMKEVFENEMDDCFPHHFCPLIRCNCFTDHERIAVVSLTISHAIADGISGLSLMIDLLNQSNSKEDAQITPQPFVPRLDAYYPKSRRSIIGKFHALSFFIPYLFKTFRVKGIPNHRRNYSVNRDLKLTEFSIGPDRYAKIIAGCREKKISVHNYISACWLKAVRSQSKSKSPVKLNCLVPVDLRGRLNDELKPTDLNLIMGCVFPCVEVAPDHNFWMLAEKVQNETNFQIKNHNTIDVWNSVPPQFLFPPFKIFSLMFIILNDLILGPLTAILSNAGCVDYLKLDNHEIELKSLSFMVAGSSSAPFAVSVVSRNKEMIINIVHSQAALADEIPDKIIDQFGTLLLSSA